MPSKSKRYSWKKKKKLMRKLKRKRPRKILSMEATLIHQEARKQSLNRKAPRRKRKVMMKKCKLKKANQRKKISMIHMESIY